ncbi:putative glycoside hydrolase [Cohnella zeiphila]|uniref:GTP-binding protein n=1 Tax=Cohnella zeiphila TaxID=2761120 RepID=A0A7X0SQ30_9BACL|nr:putative glycoside hydrolase [Cohnella zeiphila]MBB6734011.1 GTP-binding protein [Cohnella zeiphila]
MNAGRYGIFFRCFAVPFLILVLATTSPAGCASTADDLALKLSSSGKNAVRPTAAAETEFRPTALRRPGGPIRGIYVSAGVAGSRRMDALIRLVKETELNAMVIDVNGPILLPAVSSSGTIVRRARATESFRRLVDQLKKQNIYLIARVVTFKEPRFARAAPQLTMHRRDGRIWRDAKGYAWMEPFRKEAWAYPIALGEEAARIGFDEVQFDYVRFPENQARVDREVAYRNPERWSRNEAIGKFLQKATARIHRDGAIVSADVFGMVATTRSDMGIGQSWAKVASAVDVISPMVYPSHYADGTWGIRDPDLKPGPIVAHALHDAGRQNRQLRSGGRSAAEVRPWLQSFTASWVHPHQRYGSAQIRQQIEAARREGMTSYLLWNASCRYPNF